MCGWIEWGDFWKLAGAVATGAILVWIREWIVARMDRGRKQEALWLSCAAEAASAPKDFEQIKWMMDMIESGNGPISVAYVSVAGGRLAERLVELDTPNIDAYLAFMLRTAQMTQKAEDLRKELIAHAALSDANRLERRGMMHAELIHTGRAMVRQMAARLDVLRALEGHGPAQRVRGVVASAEADLKSIGDVVDQLEATYATRAGIEPHLEALRKVRPSS
jgi:hypothetical protein